MSIFVIGHQRIILTGVLPIGGELWHAQAQNWVNFDFGVQFDLEGHDQSSHKTIGLLTKVFYISGPNLVLMSYRTDKLVIDGHTDTHTHTHTPRQRQ